jgi:hypothetical protein
MIHSNISESSKAFAGSSVNQNHRSRRQYTVYIASQHCRQEKHCVYFFPTLSAGKRHSVYFFPTLSAEKRHCVDRFSHLPADLHSVDHLRNSRWIYTVYIAPRTVDGYTLCILLLELLTDIHCVYCSPNCRRIYTVYIAPRTVGGYTQCILLPELLMDIHCVYCSPTSLAKIHSVYCSPTSLEERHSVYCSPTSLAEIHSVYCFPTSLEEIHSVYCFPTSLEEIHSVFFFPTSLAEIHSVFFFPTPLAGKIHSVFFFSTPLAGKIHSVFFFPTPLAEKIHSVYCFPTPLADIHCVYCLRNFRQKYTVYIAPRTVGGYTLCLLLPELLTDIHCVYCSPTSLEKRHSVFFFPTPLAEKRHCVYCFRTFRQIYTVYIASRTVGEYTLCLLLPDVMADIHCVYYILMLRSTFCALSVDAGRRPRWITPCKLQAQLGLQLHPPCTNCEAVQPAPGLRRGVRSTPSCASLARGYPPWTPSGVNLQCTRSRPAIHKYMPCATSVTYFTNLLKNER